MQMDKQVVQDYVSKNVQPGREAEAQQLLDDAFSRQDSGHLTRAFIMQQAPQMLPLLRPGAREKAIGLAMSYFDT